MVAQRRDAITTFLKCSGSKDKKAIEESLQGVQTISTEEGLSDVEFGDLVKVLTSGKLASSLVVKLFYCLIPEKLVNSEALKETLSWFFTIVGTGKISIMAEKQFIHWITGIVHFELGDMSVIDSYYHSFFFLLRVSHMESVVSKLLSLLIKPEDAKRWTVRKILEVQKKSGPKAHTNSLLSILKSFRPDMVPENVPMTRMNYDNTAFYSYFQSAHERKNQSPEQNHTAENDIKWNQLKNYDKRSAQLSRLIPTAETVNFEPAMKCRNEKFCIMDVRDMTSLGVHCLQIQIPTQTLSLLRNVVGFHVLAFSDVVTKSRFSHKLRYTLFRVFILELEPYSSAEKAGFLDSIIGLQEYMQEGIPVVTEFLLHYLLIWDGEEFREQILNLIQWMVIKSEKDWQECFFRPLRQIFRSTGLHSKYLIIEAMSSLLRNIIASVGREENLFFDNSSPCSKHDAAKAMKEIVTFVGELVVEGIIWNNAAGRRDIITSALNFYDICSVVEFSEEFPVVLAMPPALVYGCLFSGSRVCIARFCSLVLRFWRNTIDKLLQMGRAEHYNIEIEQTYIYILDYYRCLWSNTDFQQLKDSFIFRHKAFSELFWDFQNTCGVNIKNIFTVEKSSTFLECCENSSWNSVDKIVREYPAIMDLKLFCEDQVF